MALQIYNNVFNRRLGGCSDGGFAKGGFSGNTGKSVGFIESEGIEVTRAGQFKEIYESAHNTRSSRCGDYADVNRTRRPI